MQVPNIQSPGVTPVRVDIPSLVGQSDPMVRLRRQIAAVASKDCTVLVNGQSGTGKELVARSIHALSNRAAGAFVAVDCTGLRDTLMESQLFGHVKGAFTGADTNTLGFLRAADGGTLFLDEIGELELKTQSKLLRCIQERCVTPLGSTKSVPIDVRIVAATHRNLKQMVGEGTFRQDLYYRLEVVRLELPPLSERLDDVPRLAQHFLAQLAQMYNEPARSISNEAMAALQSYAWPGNVRELANAIEHAAVFTHEPVLRLEDFPERVRVRMPASAVGVRTQVTSVGSTQLDEASIITLAQAEKELIARALVVTAGNQSKAARLLSIDRRRLYRKIKRYQLAHLTSASEAPEGADADVGGDED
jgi:DNA-binding NtrC family response regulator